MWLCHVVMRHSHLFYGLVVRFYHDFATLNMTEPNWKWLWHKIFASFVRTNAEVILHMAFFIFVSLTSPHCVMTLFQKKWMCHILKWTLQIHKWLNPSFLWIWQLKWLCQKHILASSFNLVATSLHMCASSYLFCSPFHFRFWTCRKKNDFATYLF